MIANIMGSAVIIMVAIALYPPIQEQIDLATASIQDENAKFIVERIPSFFATLVIGVAILNIVLSIGDSLYEGNDEEEYIEEEVEKDKKQSYLDYVKERKEVERLLK